MEHAVHEDRTTAPDRIRVAGIAATGYHGVFEHERRDGQVFVADVELHVDTRSAAAEDRLDLTVDYGVLAEQVVGVLTGEPARLVETVAERIAAVALTHRGVEAVDVVLHKPQAPVTVPFSDVVVHVHRDRTDHPPAVGAPPVTVAVPAGPGQTASVPPPAPAASAHDPLTGPSPGPASPSPSLSPASPSPSLSPASPSSASHSPASPDTAGPTDRLDVRPHTTADVVLALGSNLGNSQETLRQVVRDLAAVEGLEITALAPLARTGPVGGPDQPDYLNTVVLARTTLSPRELLHACQAIEDAHGRLRAERWGPRTVDIDIVVHGATVATADDLELPHPRAHQRAFVLEPWAQVDPDAVLPGLGGGPVAALAQTAPDREGIRWMALDWWGGPGTGS